MDVGVTNAHLTTGVTPSSLMFGRVFREKLPALPSLGNGLIEDIRDRDREKKMNEAEYANKRRLAEPNHIRADDTHNQRQ